MSRGCIIIDAKATPYFFGKKSVIPRKREEMKNALPSKARAALANVNP